MGLGVKGSKSALRALCTLAAAAVLSVAAAPGGAAYADDVRDAQWQLDTLHAADAWAQATGAETVVAVVDSGVDADHPDLLGKVLPGADFVSDDGGDGTYDPVGHGTSVAALIAGDNDADGVVGLAYDAKILPVRVLDKRNRYDDAGIVARAVRWAVDHGADVVNLSLGGVGRSTELAEAITYALGNDVVVVACTGNVDPESDEAQGVWFPARMPGVVAVTGLAPDGKFWDGALTGESAVLTAPADEMTSAHPDGYWQIQGTSFAAPLVSATAALIRSKYPGISAADIINRLIFTASDLGRPGRDSTYGFGLVNPAAALATAVPDVAVNPLLSAADGAGGTRPESSDALFPDATGDPGATGASTGAAAEGGDAGTPYAILAIVAVIAGAALTVTLIVLRRHGHVR